MQSTHYPISRQVCPSQKIKDQVDMDAQTAHVLQEEEEEA